MIEKAIALGAVEWEALAGLPFIQRCLYLVLRWHMDRLTGRVGDVRGISLQGLAEELYVEPVRGRHAAECGSPSKKAIRSALDGLQKSGLISACGNGEVLVFFLPKSRRVSARQNDEGHMRGTGEGHSQGHSKNKPPALANTGLLPVDKSDEGRDEGHPQNPDEGHTSSTRVNHPYLQAAAAAQSVPVDNSALLVLPLLSENVAEWIRRSERGRGCSPRVLSQAPEIAAWLKAAVTGEELREAYGLAKGDREATKNRAGITPGFLTIFVQRVIDKRVVSRGSDARPAAAAWFCSDEGIAAKAKALGIERAVDESAAQLRSRVDTALMLRDEAGRQRRKVGREKRGDLCPI